MIGIEKEMKLELEDLVGIVPEVVNWKHTQYRVTSISLLPGTPIKDTEGMSDIWRKGWTLSMWSLGSTTSNPLN